MEERIQKLLSARGIVSRRTAERYIQDGRVTVNGVLAQLGMKADPDKDTIAVDGVNIGDPSQFVYLVLNKPRGYVTTLKDEKGRRTVADLVNACGARVWPVGRLDMFSEGLLLFTNDGEFTQRLEHPSGEVSKEYLVRVDRFSTEILEKLRGPISLDGKKLRPAIIEVLNKGPDSTLLSITIHEGKNRQIRRMCEFAGTRVLKLKRIREGSLALGDLPSGKWRYLTAEEIKELSKE